MYTLNAVFLDFTTAVRRRKKIASYSVADGYQPSARARQNIGAGTPRQTLRPVATVQGNDAPEREDPTPPQHTLPPPPRLPFLPAVLAFPPHSQEDVSIGLFSILFHDGFWGRSGRRRRRRLGGRDGAVTGAARRGGLAHCNTRPIISPPS